jgi:hypothetical protein
MAGSLYYLTATGDDAGRRDGGNCGNGARRDFKVKKADSPTPRFEALLRYFELNRKRAVDENTESKEK